jgi:glutathione S-transferase
MQLYHHPFSPSARRVLMAADHLGVALDLVEINLASPDDRRRLEELNANSRIPVLVDGALVLSESCAIMQYLADRTPGQAVYPHDLAARADVNRWMFWTCQHFAPALGVYGWENMMKKMVAGEDADPVELARGARDIARAAVVIDRHLATRRWLVGDAVTLADYAVVAPLMYKEQARLPLDDYPHLLAWFARVQELPAWQRTTPAW